MQNIKNIEARPSQLPNEPLSLIARSMVERSVYELEAMQAEFSQITGLAVAQVPKALRIALIASAMREQERILEHPEGVTEAAYTQAVIDGIPNYAFEGTTLAEPSVYRQYLRETVENFENFFQPMHPATHGPGMIEAYRTAERLAAEQSLAVSVFFTDDRFYKELIRTMKTPEGYIAEAKAGIEMITPETMKAFVVNVLGRAVSMAYEEGDVDDGEVEHMNDFVRVISEHPEFTEKAKAVTETTRYGLWYVVAGQVRRFWGEEALAHLPTDVRHIDVVS